MVPSPRLLRTLPISFVVAWAVEQNLKVSSDLYNFLITLGIVQELASLPFHSLVSHFYIIGYFFGPFPQISPGLRINRFTPLLFGKPWPK